MTDLYGWQQQPGGLWLQVSPFNRDNPEDREAAICTVRTVAGTHGASFSETGFKNNLQAMYTGDLVVDLYRVKWDICDRKSHCVGGALGWETFGFTLEGELKRSFYTEDVCLLKPQVRQVVRAKPEGKDFPDESLTKCFERINLAQMAAKGMTYRFGEVNLNNTTMMRQLNDNGAAMGVGLDSAVLEYRQLPNTLMDSLPMDVHVVPIKWGGVESKRNFLVTYKENGHDLRLIATIGQATALGQRRVDIKAWHNGHMPEPAILNCVINSALLSIRRKIEVPETSLAREKVSPSIPLAASRREQFSALLNATSDQIIYNRPNGRASFGKPLENTHVSVQENADLMAGFLSTGAEPRFFGNKPMIPGVNVLRPQKRLDA